MSRRLKYFVAPLLALGLLVANIGVFATHQRAEAHSWDGYHWNDGDYVYLYHFWNGGSYYGQANAAMYDYWIKVPWLYNYWVGSHSDISIWDGNYGPTGWAGLAEIDLGWDWGCWCYRHITHGHARYNTYYGGSSTYIQGVYCQEIWHTYGFAHDWYGNCMGLGYYGGSDYRINNHNVNDFYGKYWGH